MEIFVDECPSHWIQTPVPCTLTATLLFPLASQTTRGPCAAFKTVLQSWFLQESPYLLSHVFPSLYPSTDMSNEALTTNLVPGSMPLWPMHPEAARLNRRARVARPCWVLGGLHLWAESGENKLPCGFSSLSSCIRALSTDIFWFLTFL